MITGISGNGNQIGAAPINLTKGEKINLSKEAPGLKRVLVGLGWDVNDYSSGDDYDLDASAFLVDKFGKTSPENFVFYGSGYQTPEGMKCDPAQSVIHTGDNRTGAGDGDDEQIIIDLDKVPAHIEKIAITVTIHEADRRRQNFGNVENSYIRLVDQETDREILRFELCEEFSVETAIVAAELYKYKGDWKFNAVGAGFANGLIGLCNKFGLEAEYR